MLELKGSRYGEKNMYRYMKLILSGTPALCAVDTRSNRSFLRKAVNETLAFHEATTVGTRQLTESTRGIIFGYLGFTPLQDPTNFAQTTRFASLFCSETKSFYNNVCQSARHFGCRYCDCPLRDAYAVTRIPVKRKRASLCPPPLLPWSQSILQKSRGAYPSPKSTFIHRHRKKTTCTASIGSKDLMRCVSSSRSGKKRRKRSPGYANVYPN